MIEVYTEIKWLHVAAVIASGSLFLLRGVALQGGSRWAMAAPLRYASYTIDTVLLTAAFMLLTILPGAVFANGWLTTKVSFLVAYVVLGSYALKRGHSRRERLAFLIAAACVYAAMIAIARSHHPLGALHAVLA